MSIERKESEPQIIISLATPEDARGMEEVFYQTWLATYPNEQAGITTDDIEDRFKDRFTEENLKKRGKWLAHPSEDNFSFCAKEGEKIIGVCRIVKCPDKNQLQAIYVLPEYQGKGVGTMLWEEVKKLFDSEKDTVVEVVEYNANAINFYKKLGFEDTGRRFTSERFKMKSGATLPEMEMKIKA